MWTRCKALTCGNVDHIGKPLTCGNSFLVIMLMDPRPRLPFYPPEHRRANVTRVLSLVRTVKRLVGSRS